MVGSFIIWTEREIALYFVVYYEILEFNSGWRESYTHFNKIHDFIYVFKNIILAAVDVGWREEYAMETIEMLCIRYTGILGKRRWQWI